MIGKVRCFKTKHTNKKLCARAPRAKTERALIHAPRYIDPLKHLGFYAPPDTTLR